MSKRIGKYKVGQKDFTLNKLSRYGIQRLTVDEAATIGADTSYLDCAVDAASSRVITMPSAKKGRWLRVLWTVEQATNDRVFTCAGSDTFVGGIDTKVQGNAAGDGDTVAVAAASTAITAVDDVNIGSRLDFHCLTDGVWVVTGKLLIGAIGNVPTVA